MGVISYRSQSHLARTVSNGPVSGAIGRDVDDKNDKLKPVTGICLIGLGLYFFSFGTIQYYNTLSMLARTFGNPRSTPSKKFLTSDLSRRFMMNGLVPSLLYTLSISALFHPSTRRVLCDLTPKIVTHEDLEDCEEKKRL